MLHPVQAVAATIRTDDRLAELEAAIEYALEVDASPERVERMLAIVTRVLARRGWRAPIASASGSGRGCQRG